MEGKKLVFRPHPSCPTLLCGSPRLRVQTTPAMKNRPARVKELLLRELGAIISRDFTFAAKLVTVHGVDLSADFKHCHVHVGVLGTEKEQRAAIGKLQENRPVLQHELSRRVVLKYTPQLHFHLDETMERGTKVMEIMRQIDEIVPPDDAAQDGPMDDEEPVANTEELIRLEETEDAADAPPPRRDAMEADPTKPRGRRAEDAARRKQEGRDGDAG